MLAAFAAALFVFPGFVAQAAFDQQLLTLLAVLVDDLRASAEARAVDEEHFLAVFEQVCQAVAAVAVGRSTFMLLRLTRHKLTSMKAASRKNMISLSDAV